MYIICMLCLLVKVQKQKQVDTPALFMAMAPKIVKRLLLYKHCSNFTSRQFFTGTFILSYRIVP